MNNNIKKFIFPLSIAIIVILIGAGIGVYFHTQNKQIQSAQNINSQATSTTPTAKLNSPAINNINPASVLIGSDISITGSNLNWVVPTSCMGNGCIMRPHFFVFLSGKTFKNAILFENENVVSNSSKHVTVKIKSSLCTRSQINGMPCNAVKVTPGQYTVSINIDGRGTSNSFPITITKSVSSVVQVSSTISANWKTYTNYAFGFSIKVPSNNNVYACDTSSKSSNTKLATTKDYSVFILKNPSDINLIKPCNYNELAKYNTISIIARQQSAGEYSSFTKNYASLNTKYQTVKNTYFAQHNALIKTQLGTSRNNFAYKSIIINGGDYIYFIDLNKKDSQLEKILSTFKIIKAKDSLSDWQTLKDNNLGIELKYPFNYHKDIGISGISVYPVPQPIEFGPNLDISRSINNISKNSNVNTYVDKFLNNNKAGKSVKERVGVTINGTKWVKVKYLDVSEVGPQMMIYRYFTIYNGYLYIINYYSDDTNNTFEKIVKTIKLTLSSNQKTYHNAKYGFSFEYPADLNIKQVYGNTNSIGAFNVYDAHYTVPAGTVGQTVRDQQRNIQFNIYSYSSGHLKEIQDSNKYAPRVDNVVNPSITINVYKPVSKLVGPYFKAIFNNNSYIITVDSMGHDKLARQILSTFRF